MEDLEKRIIKLEAIIDKMFEYIESLENVAKFRSHRLERTFIILEELHRQAGVRKDIRNYMNISFKIEGEE